MYRVHCASAGRLEQRIRSFKSIYRGKAASLNVRTALLGVFLALTIVFASTTLYESTSRTTVTLTSTTTTTSLAASTSTVTSTTTVSSCITASAAALTLSLSLTSSSIIAGNGIGFNASLFNTSCGENDVPSASNWGVPELVIGPAGPTASPIAFAVVPGFYTSANISSAPTIQYGVFGTTVQQGIKSYAFQPRSDVASVMICGANPCFTNTKSMSISGGFNGYWSKQEILAFTPGTYTVVVADQWGHVATASFTVQAQNQP